MAQKPAAAGNEVCRRCTGKGFVVKQTPSGNQRVTCTQCAGSGRSGYRTK